MLPTVCEVCGNQFFCKIIFKRHNKKFHSTLTRGDDISQLNFDIEMSDDEDDWKTNYKFGFWQLEMCKQMKKWSPNKFKKSVSSVFFNLTLISRALSRDAVLKRITKKARTFQKKT